jgi:hypothetical protein
VTATTDGTRPRLRPLSLGEVLDVSIKICLAHWRTLLKAVLVVVVPVQIVGTIVNADYTVESFDLGSTSSTQTPEETLEQLNQYLGGLAIAGVLQMLALLLATAACLRAIAQAYLGEQADWRSSLVYALRLAPSLLWLTLLYALGIMIGFLFAILPAIWLYVAWAFATPVLLVERQRGRKALGRSFVLVRKRWWRTFLVLVVGFILAAVVSTIVQAVFVLGIFAGKDNDVLVLVLSAIAGIVGLAVTTPFQAALLTVLYFDLRVRKEGFDLELLAQEIGATGPPGAAGAPAAAAATRSVLPPAEPIDRSGAPYWPPPPGWKPPEPEVPEDPGDAGPQSRPPPPSREPPSQQQPPSPAPDEPSPEGPGRLPGVPQDPSSAPDEPSPEGPGRLPGVPQDPSSAPDEPPPDGPRRLPGLPPDPSSPPDEPPPEEPPRLPGVPYG